MENDFNLGQFEQFVLAAVKECGSNAYGGGIQRKLEEWSQGASPGGVYVVLGRLEAKGYLKSWFGEATPERGGKAKKYFELTGAGERALRAATERAAELTTLGKTWGWALQSCGFLLIHMLLSSTAALAQSPPEPITPLMGRWTSWDTVTYVVSVVGFLFVIFRLLDLLGPKVSRGNGFRRRHEPPVNARFVIHLFMTRMDANALLGDEDERFHEIRRTIGFRKAKWVYWSKVIASVGPLLCGRVRSWVIRISGLTAAGEVIRRLLS